MPGFCCPLDLIGQFVVAQRYVWWRETNKRSNITHSVAGSFVIYHFALPCFSLHKLYQLGPHGGALSAFWGLSSKLTLLPFPLLLYPSTSLTLLSHQFIAFTHNAMTSVLHHGDHYSSPCIITSLKPETTLHAEVCYKPFFYISPSPISFPSTLPVSCELRRKNHGSISNHSPLTKFSPFSPPFQTHFSALFHIQFFFTSANYFIRVFSNFNSVLFSSSFSLFC